MMADFDLPISEIVQADYRTADVFKKYLLNYCCGGQISLKSACDNRAIDYESLIKDLKESTRNNKLSGYLLYHEWKIDFLIDFITNIHHSYIYQVLPTLATDLKSFSMSHRKKYPHLEWVADLLDKLSSLLTLHNRHEDEIIFPYIKQIDSAFRRKEAYGNLFVRTLRKPLDIIEREHIQIQMFLNSLFTMTNHFTIPDKACTSFHVLYHKLEEFYDNLIQHKFLEHNILFPKAIAIEHQLLLL
jgi:regulator of cell morphogenesis and NO signaling